MNREQFTGICKKSQNELKQYVVTKLKKRYEKLWIHKDFVYAKGTVPICLVAHLDTVHDKLPEQIVWEKDRVSSPQGIGGDDRCGVYAILQIIQKHNCSVLFCCDEEVGGLGALAFSQTSLCKEMEVNYMIELDRKGKNDAVFYDCDNPAFTKFITDTGMWGEDFGSFSDISEIAPEAGVAAVNLSVGYYNQHTQKEYVVPSEVDKAIDCVCKLIEKTTEADKFEYIEAVYDYKSYYGKRYGYNFKRYDNYGYYDESVYLIQYEDNNGEMHWVEIEACGEYEAIGKFVSMYEDIPFRQVFDVMDESMYAYSQK